MLDSRSVFDQLPDALLPWYDRNKRQLPWRQDKDPYHIWLSEIMLQQTRVEAVKGYYERFLQALPTVEDLANADDEQLHKLWEGLGYYSRVRNLKKAANVILQEHGGVFPGEYNKVLALPGVGEYTAGAVCSIAFEQKKAAVDGNVMRVICRLTDDITPIDQPVFRKQVRVALETVYPDRAGDFTQALMELGATVCGPNRKPDCEKCPCRGFCLGSQRGTAEELPVRPAKKNRRIEEKTVLIMSCAGKYALRKRPEKGLLAGLWEFPHVPGLLETDAIIDVVEKLGVKPMDIQRILERKHVFTHVQWDMRGVYLDVADCADNFCWFTPEQIRADAALPTAFRQFWEAMDHV